QIVDIDEAAADQCLLHAVAGERDGSVARPRRQEPVTGIGLLPGDALDQFLGRPQTRPQLAHDREARRDLRCALCVTQFDLAHRTIAVPFGTTAVASISTLASPSISALTSTMVIVGKCRPITLR